MKKASLILSLLFSVLGLPVSVFAQKEQIILGDNQTFGVPAFRNPNASVGNILGNALQILAIFGGLAVLVFIVWGAFDWITSGGDKEKIAGARKKITNALIGLALLALSAFIVSLAGQIVGYNPLSPTAPPLPKLDQQPVSLQAPAAITP